MPIHTLTGRYYEKFSALMEGTSEAGRFINRKTCVGCYDGVADEVREITKVKKKRAFDYP